MTASFLLATSNQHKVLEFKSIFSPYDVVLHTPTEFGILSDVEENGSTYYENAYLKAQSYWQGGKFSVLADDSGLEVEALDGAPGIHSNRLLPDPNATSTDRCLYLLELLKPFPPPWRAAFHCEVVFLDQQGRLKHSHGICSGQIIPEFRGKNGFGYDPIFLVDSSDQTMAELEPSIKNQISHRAKAVLGMISLLKLPLRQD